MNGTIKGVAGLVCAVGMFAASAARADIAPPDACNTANVACHNAGQNYDKDGKCTATTCSRGGPQGQVTTYDCFKCEPDSSPAAAGATSDTETDAHKDEGGCSIRALGTEKGIASLMLGLGLVALGVSRRRR